MSRWKLIFLYERHDFIAMFEPTHLLRGKGISHQATLMSVLVLETPAVDENLKTTVLILEIKA